MSNIVPPQNKKELYQAVTDIVRHGTYTMPDKYQGTGAPGDYLQEGLLGIPNNNKDTPDSLGYEVKFFSLRTNLITLFHKTPQPKGVMNYMVSRFGWKDKNGCQSFRHTISGKSDRFQVFTDGEQIIIRRLKGNGLVPYWTHDDILSAAGAKLRRLVLVRGIRKLREVTYQRADCYENLQLTEFVREITIGTIKVDFDAREMKPGSKGLRDHGTKFRISPNDICGIYSKKERIC